MPTKVSTEKEISRSNFGVAGIAIAAIGLLVSPHVIARWVGGIALVIVIAQHASLAKLGLDRASVDAFFAKYVMKGGSPDVAHWRNTLKGHRELLTLLQEAAATAQADFAAAIKAERDMEVRIMLEKVDCLRKIARRQHGMADETTEKPKRKRNSRRS